MSAASDIDPPGDDHGDESLAEDDPASGASADELADITGVDPAPAGQSRLSPRRHLLLLSVSLLVPDKCF